MTQIALARRYRPSTFEALVGQQAVARALCNALSTQQLHHAYLFSGMRGVGKTTVARIFAKCLNCEQGISAQPCGVCRSCVEISEGRFVDLLEVDAASRTRVEDTRDLLENVQYLPTQGRFKIYLIDEVHMLSNHSFNALLKTLEEPPSHVKFILATTDPQKIPLTVLSRCLQFHLQPLPFSQIEQHLAAVLDQEKISYEKEALHLLSLASEGSLRDALSLTEQAVAYEKNHLTEAGLQRLFGKTPHSILTNMLSALIAGQANLLWKALNSLDLSTNFSDVLSGLLSLIHQVSVVQEIPEAIEELTFDRVALRTFSETAASETLQLFYQIGVQGQRDLNYAPSPKIGFEMTILRMLAFRPFSIIFDTPSGDLQRTETPSQFPEKMEMKIEQRLETPPSWAHLINKLALSGVPKQLAENCSIIEWQTNTIHLMLAPSEKALFQKRHLETIQLAIRTYLNRDVDLKISFGTSDQPSPAVQKQQTSKVALETAKQNLKQDAHFLDIMGNFDAKLESIELIDTKV